MLRGSLYVMSHSSLAVFKMFLFQQKGFKLQQESTWAGNQAPVVSLQLLLRPETGRSTCLLTHLLSCLTDVSNSPGWSCLSVCPRVSAPPRPSASPGASTCRTIQNQPSRICSFPIPHHPYLGQTTPALPLMAVVPCCVLTPQSALHTPQPDHISSHPPLLHTLCGHPSANTRPCQALPGPVRSRPHFLPPCSLLPTSLQPTGLPIFSHTPRPFLPLLLLVLPSRILFLMSTWLPHLGQIFDQMSAPQ